MKSVIRVFQTALRALSRNVMRSALTCVGIIIGIAAVIAMTEIGNGVSELNARAIASLGANTLMIQPGAATNGGFNFGQGSIMTLTPQDCDAIMRDCPSVKAAAPVVGAGAQVSYGNRNGSPQIRGTTPEYLEVREWALDEGSCFTEQDVRNSSKVCIIGQTPLHDLFAGESPIGKEIRVGSVNLRVVGVLVRKGANMMGQDQDNVVIAPWTTIKYRVSGKGESSSPAAAAGSASSSVNSLKNLYPSGSVQLYPTPSEIQAADRPQPIRFANVGNIMAAAKSSADIPAAIEEINGLLHERHRIRSDQADDFDVRDMTEVNNTLASTTVLIGKLLFIVASISLIVGGVGIMNIMLVSVTERTREIGLRMAVGARARDILLQFLVEATLLCLMGGILGIGIGRFTTITVKYFTNWPTAVSIPAIVVSVVVSAIVGIVFGFYPAWKASRLDPIDALRYE